MNVVQRLKKLDVPYEPCKGMILVDNMIVEKKESLIHVDQLTAVKEDAVSEFLVIKTGTDCNYKEGDIVKMKMGSSPVAVEIDDMVYLQFFDHNVAGRVTDTEKYKVREPRVDASPSGIIASA